MESRRWFIHFGGIIGPLIVVFFWILIHLLSLRWRIDCMAQYLPQNLVTKIMHMVVPDRNSACDIIAWSKISDVFLSMKTTYEIVSNSFPFPFRGLFVSQHQ